METLAEQINKLLLELGPTADQVVTNLSTRKIQGVRNTVRILNPIVRYVAQSLLVSNLGMDVMNPDVFRLTLLDGKKVEVALPQAVKDFLTAFDHGSYPDLEMPIEHREEHDQPHSES